MGHVERKLLDQFALHCANNPVLDVTFLHEQEGRHRLDTELLSNGLQFININLQENSIWMLLGQISENWSHDAAWPTPRCGEVDHHLLLRKVY